MKQMVNNKSLLAIGECMVELTPNSEGESLYRVGFAGDTLNALIYAKRWVPSLKCGFYSAIGEDSFSGKALNFFEQHGINSTYVVRSKNRKIGLYSIVNDESGERSFDYWRDHSAARVMMSLHKARNTVVEDTGVLFFSGIALSIMSEEDKQLLIDFVELNKRKGVKIAFDPNYRSIMWNGKKHAQQWFDKAYALADIALPGMDDHSNVYGHGDVHDVFNHLNALGCKEIIVKAGSRGMHAFSDGELLHHQSFRKVNQKDTTAAGDSFAGVYLGSRIAGQSVIDSVQAADTVAREVVQYQGAIIPEDVVARAKQGFTANMKQE